MVPVVATLATALPLTVPNEAEATVAIFAAPPMVRPETSRARSMKVSPPPVRSSIAPNSTKAAMIVEAMPVSEPQTPMSER